MGRNTVSVIGNEVAMAAKASALSLQSRGHVPVSRPRGCLISV